MENRVPFFSVIVPVYNTEKFLPFCINSVLSQTFRDFEIILVDDGSTDGSPELCDLFASRHEGLIEVFHKANEGLFATRMFGNSKSRGQYIVSLDSDDGLKFDALEILHDTIVSFRADLVLFGFSIDETFVEKYRNDISLSPNCLLPRDSLFREYFSRSINNIWGKTFRREIAPSKEALGDFVNVKIGEDIIQSGYVLEKSDRVVYVDELLYFYRQHDSSMTHSFNPDILLYSCIVAKYFYGVLERVSVSNGNREVFLGIIDPLVVYDCCSSISSIVRHSGSVPVIPKEIDCLYDAYERCPRNKVKKVQIIVFELFKRKKFKELLFLLNLWDKVKKWKKF